MAEFGTGKTIFILAIVVGCFAVLWPKIFYPMLLSSISGTPPQTSVPPVDTSQGMQPPQKAPLFIANFLKLFSA